MRPASLALVLLITVAGRSAALSGPPPPSCPIQKTEPWASSSGCCCCQGECIYKNCPPCPCPAPLPGKPQPKCSLGSIRAAFASNYRAVIGKVKESEWPSKTQASGGHWSWATSAGWTSGFFPGLLWQLANATADAAFATAAAQWTAGREVEKTETSGHDIGFMIFGSFGNGVQLGSSNVSGYTSVVVEAAHSLAKRYNPTVGMTRSWGDIDDEKSFEVIIDNLMNLELLFWASAASGNSTLGAIAKSHATKTGQLWIREDGSTAHLCVFDPKTGKLQKPCTGTPQGLAADSTWARGQGWGIYGFTLAFRYTHDKSYLDFAEKVASFYLAAALPSLIPKWDFNATDTSPGGGAALDTSSATIAASALLELSVFTGKQLYHDAAVHIIHAIGYVKGALSAPGASDAVLALNQHDCKSDQCTLIETEYYMYEALRRLDGSYPPETAAATLAAQAQRSSATKR